MLVYDQTGVFIGFKEMSVFDRAYMFLVPAIVILAIIVGSIIATIAFNGRGLPSIKNVISMELPF